VKQWFARYRTQLTSLVLLVVVLAAVIGGAVALVTLVYRPLMAEQAALAQELKKQETRLAELRRIQRRLPLLRQELAATREELDYLSEKLPPDPRQPSFLTYLELGAVEHGVAITRLDFADPEPVEEGYLQLPVHLVLVAPYPNFVAYLEYLEQIPRTIRLEALRIGPYAAGNEDGSQERTGARETTGVTGTAGDTPSTQRVRIELEFSLFIDPGAEREVMAAFERLRDRLGRSDPFLKPERQQAR